MLLFFCLFLQQNSTLQFDRISVLDGLSQSQVLAVAQDHFGFMWFGTQDGLNRYDGYQFDVFRIDSEPKALTNNHVQALLVDRQNRLWIGTKEGGLMLWDLNGDTMVAYRHDETDPQSLSADNIWSLFEDSSGRIWIGTMGGGLNLWLAETKTFKRFEADEANAQALSNNHVRCFYEDDLERLWIGTDNGLNRLTEDGEHFVQFRHDPGRLDTIRKGNIFAMEGSANGDIWIGTIDGGLNVLDLETETFSAYRHEPGQLGSLSSNRIWSLFRDQQNRLWVGTMDQGMNLWDPETGTFETIRHSGHPKSLSSNKIWSIFEDRSGILWIGTGDHGVNKLNAHTKPFAHLPKPNPETGAAPNFVTMALAPAGDQVWTGTWGQGLHRFDPQSQVLEKVDLEPHPSGRPRLFVSLYAQDSQSLWMGYWGFGLTHLNVATLEETSYIWDDAPEKTNHHVIQIKPFGNQLLLATYGYGVLKFDPISKTFSRFENGKGPIEALAEGNFFTSFQTNPNELWLGTVGKGLHRLNLQSNTLTTYTKDPSASDQLLSNRITVLLEDSQSRFWVGTDGGGMAQFIPETNRFRRITTQSGLPSNVINGIIEGPSGNLWIATNKGLDYYDPQAETHRIFGPDDGVQLEYNAGVFSIDRAGNLLFGGPKGIDYFQPTAIKQNPYIPQIAITQFKVFNQAKDLPGSLNTGGIIDLNYTDNFFAFEFAAMDYTNPAKNRFRVQLGGVDKDWVYNDTRNYKEYTNLRGGTYTFRVQGSNGDGIWNETGAEITVRITPPFWQARSFHILLAAFLLMLVISTVHFFERKKILRLMKRQMEQRELNQRLAEAREVERLEIAQEIHDGPIQDLHAIQFQMSLARQKNDYTSISKYLLSVISSLRRLCGQLRPPALVPFGLAAAIRSLVDTLGEKYPEMNITLDLDNDGQRIPEDQRMALFRICQESLNNALQHSSGTQVHVMLRVDNHGLKLIVNDNGVGFQLDDSLLAFSSRGHYGLLGIFERVQTLGGTVDFETAPGKGTQVKVLIPSTRHKPQLKMVAGA